MPGRSAGRWRTCGRTCWTRPAGPRRSASPASCTSAASGVARGYLGRPGLTAERFVPDPVRRRAGRAAVPHGRPGAVAGGRRRWSSWAGPDEQVKVRGFRIEPGEIEARAAAHAGVRDCAVVVAREDAPGEQAAGGVRRRASAEADALRAHLRRQPAGVHGARRRSSCWSALPLTPNGKLDRKALPAPDVRGRRGPVRGAADAGGGGAGGDLGGGAAAGAAWAWTTSFFELGGHSLLATRVVSRVRAGVRRGAAAAGALRGAHGGGAGRARGGDAPRGAAACCRRWCPIGRTGPLPLSFAQERLWFLDRLEPGSAVYNIPVALRLGGALDAAALERALGEIVRRHEALRTTFAEVDGAPVQVIAPFGGLRPAGGGPVGAGRGGSRGGGPAARRRGGAAAVRPVGGPARSARRCCGWARTSTCCCSRMHHIVSDGWSMGVLFRELSALYAAYREGRESPLPELARAVRGLRRVAARAAAGRGAGAAAGVLAGAAGRRAGAAGAAHGPSAPGGADVPGRARAPIELPAALLERLRGAGPARGRDAVHGAAGRLPGAAVASTAGARTSSWAAPSRGGRGGRWRS